MAIDLTVNPYFDDFDKTKNYHKILFRPSYAVQARELTQTQTILQNQIESLGKSIYREGSIVTGGQTLLETTSVKYVCIEAIDPNNLGIDVSNFIGKFIVDGDGAGIRAYVIAGAAATATSPTVLIVKYTSGQIFNVSSTQPIATEDGAFSANLLVSLLTPINFTDVTSASILGDASICSINEGVFFVGGYFVDVSPQTVILDAFSNTPSFRVGLQVEDAIIDSLADASLLDPAQGATNFQAPGATRYKYALSLVKRSLTSTDDSQFIEMLRVVNGQLTKKVVYPVYSVLEDTLARRTNDQSGSFTVRPFKIAFEQDATYANAYAVVVEAGKAYVQGYEFETIAPFYLKAERARDLSNVTNYITTIDYQNWIEFTNLVGPVPLKTLQVGTLHCVNKANIATTNAAAASNTVIGTVRLRALEYQSGANSTSIQTAVWRGYAFDTNVTESVVANCRTGVTGTSNTIYLAPNFSSVANAYVGVKFTITSNAGLALIEHHTIGQYDGPTNKVTLQGTETFAFGIPGSMTQFRLNYELKDAEALVYANTSVNQHVYSTSMDVNASSKEAFLIDRYEGAFISDTGFTTAILQFPYASIADQSVVGGLPITGSEYWGRKVYVNQSFSADVLTITSATGITSAVNGAPISGSDAIDNILVVMRNNTGATLANNQVINFTNASNTVSVSTVSNTSTWTITVPGSGSASAADVYVKVKLPYSHTIGSLVRAKSARLANVANAMTSGGTTMPDANSGLVQYFSQGSGTLGAQINIYANSSAWLKLKNSLTSQSVYVADAIGLRKVFDLGSNTPSDANVAIATDITARYTLDTGQRDSSYDHGAITLKAQTQGPTGNVVIYVDYLSHSGLGYLTVDSYASANISYGNIPSYIGSTGDVFQLRDCIDFRPRRQDADKVGSFDEEIFGISGLSFETDFSYYLPRFDKVVLTKDRTFELLQGVSSLNPKTPADKENSMTLYSLELPAYTANTSEIRQRYTDNRRYTMRDIGTLEKRITNLEYYTTLNQLEQAAKNKELLDDFGSSRFKNGILVDGFTGHSIGDVLNPDYHCSIDTLNQELRPPFTTRSLALSLDESSSSLYSRTGAILSMPYTTQTLIDQPWSSESINVNPFNTVSFIGNIRLDPSSDIWSDTNRVPDLHVNLEGDNDAWAALSDTVNSIPSKTFGTTWNSWQTQWTGVSQASQIISPSWRGWLGATGRLTPVFAPVVNRTTTSITQKQTRTGVQTSFAPQVITTSIGDKVIDESVIPKMRSRGVLFIGKMFAPNTNLYAFFDGTAVTSYCNRPNIVKVSSNTVVYKDTYQEGEAVRVWDPAGSKNTASGIVVLSRNEPTYSNVSLVSVTGGDDANVANAYVIHATNSTFLIGRTSGANSRISGYYHNSGFVSNPNTTSILLSHNIANSNVGISNTTIVGKTIYFTAGAGEGQSATITSYNYLTRNVAFSPALTTSLDTSTAYSIGQLQSDYRGELTGIFVIPSSNAVSFRTGERQFTLADSLSGVLTNSDTNGSVKYFAAGILKTVENTVISTRQPGIQRTVLTGSQTVVSTTVSNQTVGRVQVGYYDPLAQTFLVDQKFHPSGVMVTGVRLLFKSKDLNIPIQVQLRPVVNGFPHSSQVVPGTDTVVNPSDVTTVDEASLAAKYTNTIASNPMDDSALYTQVNFEGPVYLAQGAEYAVVLIANSVKYQVYISNMGGTIIGTKRLISSQPYLGSLFKSQNATTWTPVQEQDLAFRILYAQFDPTVQANIEFELAASNAITANVPLDTFFATSGNMTLPNTSITALYTTTTVSGIHEPATVFELQENVYFDDTLGGRAATTDPASFKLRFVLASNNKDISPLIDMDRLSVLAIENLVNNLPLSNTLAVVTSSSTNWQTAANLTLTISGGGGAGANAYIANTQIDSIAKVLSNVVVDVVGSGYTSAPTITLSGNTSLSAEILVAGEDRPFGGPSVARYITRMVTLDEDMDAGDFRVYFSAYKPLNASIHVYYKILSADDLDTFDNKNYQLMTVIQGANSISQNQLDIKDYVYAPGTNNIADDRVQYGSFVSFKYFAIKIVMASTETTKVPRIRALRVIAIPSLS